MESQTFLFYDLETTGLNCAFDQVLQFAAIRTDLSFNEISRHEIILKLRPDVVPSPEAMLAHRFSLAESSKGVCEYDATKEIHALLNEPGTISLGYNTLGFDDEFLRFSFHRNLLPPYTHQYANQCARMDLLPMVTTYWLYKPDVLTWPEIDGKPSLKLEHLKDANSLAPGRAHDAVTDVEASVELARRLAHEQEMWLYLRDCFDKSVDQMRLEKLKPASTTLPEKFKLGLLVRVNLGSENNYQAPVLYLGNSNAYRNQTIWLRLDRPELQESTTASIDETTWVQRKKWGESGIILPPLERFMQKIDPERSALLSQNIAWLEAHPDLLQAISGHHRDFTYPEVPNVDLDAALYQIEFMSDKERALSEEFHALPAQEKAGILPKIRRPEIHEIAKRVLFRNFPDDVPFDLSGDMKTHFDKINPKSPEHALTDYRGRRKLTPQEARAVIHELRTDGEPDDSEKKILLELDGHLQSTFPRAAQD